MNIYDSYIDAGQEMSLKDRKDFYCAVIEYIAYDRSPEYLRGAAKATWVAILPSLELSKTRSQAGKSGGSAAQQNRVLLASKTPSKTSSKRDSSHVSNGEANGQPKNKNKNITTNTGVFVVRNDRFSPPSPDDVSAYAAEKGYPNFDAERFCNFYESKGWMVGKTKMRDWKAAARNWMKKDGGGNEIYGGSSW